MTDYILITRQLAEELDIDLNQLDLFYRKTNFDQGSYNVVTEVYVLLVNNPIATWILMKYPSIPIHTMPILH